MKKMILIAILALLVAITATTPALFSEIPVWERHIASEREMMHAGKANTDSVKTDATCAQLSKELSQAVRLADIESNDASERNWRNEYWTPLMLTEMSHKLNAIFALTLMQAQNCKNLPTK